jgi:hypothetical protein
VAAREIDWEAVIDAAAPMLDLTIEAAWRPGVRRFLGLAAEMAATLDAVGLAEDRLDLDAVLVLPAAAP